MKKASASVEWVTKATYYFDVPEDCTKEQAEIIAYDTLCPAIDQHIFHHPPEPLQESFLSSDTFCITGVSVWSPEELAREKAERDAYEAKVKDLFKRRRS